MQIAIVGTGRMARGIAYGLRETPHDLTFGSRRPEEATALAAQMSADYGRRYHAANQEAAVARADVTFLALPWPAALPFVAAVRAHLDGRTLIDLTNPLRPTLDGLVIADGTSAAEEIALAAGPRTRVVAALKNTFAATFAEPTIGGGPAPDVLIAGDDAGAREQVAALVQAMGFSPLDAGPLVAARIIERMTLLLLQLNARHRWNGQAGFRVLR